MDFTKEFLNHCEKYTLHENLSVPTQSFVSDMLLVTAWEPEALSHMLLMLQHQQLHCS